MHPKYPNVFSPIRLGPVEIPDALLLRAARQRAERRDQAVRRSRRLQRRAGEGRRLRPGHRRAGRARARPDAPAFAPSAGEHRRLPRHGRRDPRGGRQDLRPALLLVGRLRPVAAAEPAGALRSGPRRASSAIRTGRVSTHAMSKDEIAAMLAAVRQSAAQPARGRVRRHHAARLARRADRAVPLALFQPAHRRIRRQPRKPHALPASSRCRRRARGPAPIWRSACASTATSCCPAATAPTTAREVVRRICARGPARLPRPRRRRGAAAVPSRHADRLLEPQQFYRPFVEEVRGAAGDVPVLSVLGRMTSMAEAEAAIAAGVCDVVGAARQLIAEPRVRQERPRRAGRTAAAPASPATGARRRGGDGAQGCTINPASYRERLWGVDSFAPAARPSKVVIVGGGPGGLEAARVSAHQGPSGHPVRGARAAGRRAGAVGRSAGPRDTTARRSTGGRASSRGWASTSAWARQADAAAVLAEAAGRGDRRHRRALQPGRAQHHARRRHPGL